MAKTRKPNSDPPESAGAPASEPAGTGDDPSAGDFPVFAPGAIPARTAGGSAPAAPPPVAEGDITLDEHESRQQQRPRLPEQRREVKSFEMASSITPARESTAPEPVAGARQDGSAATPSETEPDADEIETYDPLASEVAAPASSGAAPPPKPAPKVEIPVTPGLDDLEEFIARTATEGRATDKTEKVRRPLTLVEKICSAAGIAILVTSAVWLITSITSQADGRIATSAPWPNLPMAGSLVTISEAASNWRKREDTDRVAQMEVILPVPGQQMPEVIPQVAFTIDTGRSTSGYLRFIFRDTEGKSRGDTRVIHVENVKLKNMGKGEIIKSETEGAIYGSYGLITIGAYRSYEGDNRPRWSVEIAESPSYNANDKDWKVLGTFNVRNDFSE